MAELAGESREALAAAIFVQYAFAPFSITLWCAYPYALNLPPTPAHPLQHLLTWIDLLPPLNTAMVDRDVNAVAIPCVPWRRLYLYIHIATGGS